VLLDAELGIVAAQSTRSRSSAITRDGPRPTTTNGGAPCVPGATALEIAGRQALTLRPSP